MNERPIKDCLKMLQRDIRLMNLAAEKQAPKNDMAELHDVLDRMIQLATAQVIAETRQDVYQEAHC